MGNPVDNPCYKIGSYHISSHGCTLSNTCRPSNGCTPLLWVEKIDLGCHFLLRPVKALYDASMAWDPAELDMMCLSISEVGSRDRAEPWLHSSQASRPTWVGSLGPTSMWSGEGSMLLRICFVLHMLRSWFCVVHSCVRNLDECPSTALMWSSLEASSIPHRS